MGMLCVWKYSLRSPLSAIKVAQRASKDHGEDAPTHSPGSAV